ncbi:MAG: PilZ domain-containing protein [Hyphomicrobiaceae bacterium]|nr:PilZ domain-containing protein [Hyphomicrobiaceae bacterium]
MPALIEQLSAGTTRAVQLESATQLATAAGISDAVAAASLTQRLDVVTAIIGGWIWETDAEHRFTYMSPSVERFDGRKPDWHYGRTRQQLGNMSERTADGQSWVDQLAGRRSFGPVDFVLHRNGTMFRMRTVGHPQFGVDGSFTGYIGVAFEVPQGSKPEPAERRAAPRRKVVRAAEIIYASDCGTSSMTCVLADVSPTGAKLRLPVDAALPDIFTLDVPALSLNARCAVRWRRDAELGVELMARPEPAVSPSGSVTEEIVQRHRPAV